MNPINLSNPAFRFHKDGTTASNDDYIQDKITENTTIGLGSQMSYSTAIAEYKITNPDGLTYVYGLPVFSKNEIGVSVGIKEDLIGILNGCSPSGGTTVPPAAIFNEHLIKTSANAIQGEQISVYGDLVKNKTIVGERKDVPYPTSYLMTELFTPDCFLFSY